MNNTKRAIWGWLANALTVLLALLWLVPLVFALLMSVRPENVPIVQGNIFFATLADVGELGEGEANLPVFTTENYRDALSVATWGYHFYTSVVFVVGVLVVQFITVTLAGYAFARMKFAGRNVLLFLILLQLMIPTGVLLVQNLALIRALPFVQGVNWSSFSLEMRPGGWYDTRWALMAPYWGSAFGVLLLRQTFREVPYELEEAARIDGATTWQILFRVYIPLSVPAYVAFSLVSISSHWNEFLWPFIVTRTEQVRPLTAGLNKLYSTTDVGAQYGQLMAGTVLVIAPLVLLFVLFQRRFIESFASSGIK